MSNPAPNKKVRINKYLASAGVCSRRKADELIESGRVTFNAKAAMLGDRVGPEDTVIVDGKIIKPESRMVYIMFHKPFGAITTTDPNSENNVLDYINVKQRIFPIGRLDVHSSGLLLLTNDGDLAQKISRAENKVDKEYLVTIDKPLTEKAIYALENGIKILGRLTMPATVEKISNKQFSIVINEGRNRQIRRMCEALGYEVLILKRTRVANLRLNDLQRGKWRNLTEEEVSSIS